MRRSCWSIPAALLPLSFASVASLAAPPAGDVALVGGTLYRSARAEPTHDATLLVRDGRITEVGPAGSIVIPGGTRTLDVRGMVVLPGFQNSHVHLFGPLWDNAAEMPAERLAARLQDFATRFGFTTIVDIGSILDNTNAIRRRVESSELPGPRILTSGETLFPVDGIPYYAGNLDSTLRAKFPQPADSDASANAARTLLDHGADLIKLYLVTYPRRGVTRPMRADVARAAATEAHRRGRLVFAHPSTEEGLELALGCGVDVLAHAIEIAPHWNDATAARVARAGITMIPTLTLFHHNPVLALLARLVSRTDHFAMVAGFVRAGGRIVFGTDAGYIPQVDPTEEYRLMARAGLGARDIIASLTSAPAELFGEQATHGRLERGMAGDVTVLWGDPLRNVAQLANVRYTIRAGRVIYAASAPRREPGPPLILVAFLGVLVVGGGLWVMRRWRRHG